MQAVLKLFWALGPVEHACLSVPLFAMSNTDMQVRLRRSDLCFPEEAWAVTWTVTWAVTWTVTWTVTWFFLTCWLHEAHGTVPGPAWNRSEPFWTVQNRSADTFGPATFRTNLWRKTRAKWEVGPMAHQWRPRKSRSILRHVGVTSVKLWRKNLSTWLLNRNPSANACKADLLEKSLEQQARKASWNLVAAKRLKEPLGASSEHQFTNSYTSYLQMGHRGLVWKKTLCGTPLRTSTSRNIKKCKWQSVILFYANISLIRCL